MRRRLATIFCALLAGAEPALAAEGGSGLYLQGSRGDFAAGIFGAAGLYLRNDLIYYDAAVGPRPLGGRAALGAQERVWVNTATFAYLSDLRLLGARWGASISLPVILNARVSGQATTAGAGLFRSGDVGGFGDVYIAPLRLNWSVGNHHLTLSPAFQAPTGRYSTDRLLNTGKNHWGFDLAATYTWLDPRRGHELSFTAGYLINTRNDATGYRNGDEFHLDWLIGQHLSQRLAVGATGYWYHQVTGDKGVRPAALFPNGFRGEGVGLGLAVLGTPHIAGRDISLIGKWIHDVHTENRLRGDLFMLSVAFRL
jgi:hypothetical protein